MARTKAVRDQLLKASKMGLTDNLRKKYALVYNALRISAIHFRNEETKYLAKDELEKARANAIMAAMCEEALQEAENVK